MKFPLQKSMLFFSRSAIAAAILLLVFAVIAVNLDRFFVHDQSASIRFGRYAGKSEQHIIEIYQSDGRHTLQDPPTDVAPIVLKIPENFRVYHSKGATRDWDVNLLTYYPGFTSPQDPENAKFGLSCAGFCNGQMLVHIENRGRSFKQSNLSGKQYYSLTAAHEYARQLLQEKKELQLPGYHRPNLHVTDYAPEAGFDVIFEKLYTTMEDAPNIIPGHFAEVKRFYLRWNQAHEYYDLVADCHIPSGANTFERFTCKLRFSLACNPAVSIQVTGVDGKYLSVFGESKRKQTDLSRQ